MKKSLVLGFFDGVHKAHKAVISSAFEYSQNVSVITFLKSPAFYFGLAEEYIMSREDSIQKIKELGVEEVIQLNFSDIVSTGAYDYLKYLVNTYNPISISTGFNHTFGKNREGNPEFLKTYEKEFNYKYICTPPVEYEGHVVSSSLIREYLRNGQIERANFLLESDFKIKGEVIHGAKIGRTIGFPTANIKYPINIIKIPFGVYKVKFKRASGVSFHGIMNWGMKPTVHNTIEPICEVHLFDFNDDLYGEQIQVEVQKQIRPEQKFESIEELKSQIEKDIKSCLEL